MESVQLANLVRAEDPIIKNKTFENKRIVGPGILLPVNGTAITNNAWKGSAESILWELPEGPLKHGMIIADSCTFKNCEFVGVGLIVPRDKIQETKKGFGL